MAIGFTESVQDLPTAAARSVKLGRVSVITGSGAGTVPVPVLTCAAAGVASTVS